MTMARDCSLKNCRGDLWCRRGNDFCVEWGTSTEHYSSGVEVTGIDTDLDNDLIQKCNEVSTVVIKTECEDEGVMATQELDMGHIQLEQDYMTDTNMHIKQEDGLVIKRENEINEVTVKQEIDIGPMVLQRTVINCPLLPIAEKGIALRRDEVALLVDLIQHYKAITSKVSALNNRLKEEAWIKLTNTFNANITSCPRSVEQLKWKWANLKKAARKRAQSLSMNMTKTGGGKSCNILPDDTLDRVADILEITCHGYIEPFGVYGDKTLLPEKMEDMNAPIFENSSDVCVGTNNECNIVKMPEFINIDVIEADANAITITTSNGAQRTSIKEKFLNSTKNINGTLKRRLVEDDMKIRTKRNKALTDYYRVKLKKEKMELENKRLQIQILKLDMELLRLKNEKLGLEIIKKMK